jgi:pyruvate/2-oxoglutarate dehydrogenase complex dihydrolipoamide dehydrogenase (E3) component
MPLLKHYEALFVGSGEAGKYLAWHLGRQGQSTAVIERRWIGGSCPNINCLPSKNEIWSAKVSKLVQGSARFGVSVDYKGVDMKGVVARKRDMVKGLIRTHLDVFESSGVELIMGEARLTGPRAVDVTLNDGGTAHLTADRLFLSLGTHAAVPEIPGLGAAKPLTHVELLEIDWLPSHLIVLGGGYVGLELAQAYRRFGAAVTLIDRGPRLTPREDPEVSVALLDMLRDEGMTIHLKTQVLKVSGLSGDRVMLQVGGPSGDLEIEGSDILVAAGRVPNTAGIGLQEFGIEIDQRGYITVNERLETSLPGVWAMGECAGSPQFTHAAFDDYRVVRDTLSGLDRTTRDRLIPYCMFTDPPLARVGLSEAEAAQHHIAYRTASLPMASVLRSRTISETLGFMKVLVAADSDRILGFTMLGPEAGEVMAVVQTAMLAGMPYTRLRDAIFAHPTMAEGLNVLLTRVPAR